MDINSFINTLPLFSPNRLVENALNLKVGQQLDVKVIGSDVQAAKNAITLTLGDKDITVQSNQPITISPGQDLKIQVTQIAPSIEFKILDSLPELKAKIIQLQDPQTQTAELRLKLIPTAKDGGSAATGTTARMQEVEQRMEQLPKEPMRPTAGDSGSVAIGKELDSTSASSQPRQPLDAKILSIIGTKIQLQISSPSLAEPGSKQAALITIDRTQLTNAPSDLKVGQNLNLEIVKAGTAPEFKIIPAAVNIPEAKVAEFVKQFLPRHEAAPIFLNQLIKDLPKLMKNESVPQALKDIAAKIIQNLPPKEQLITSQGLKQSIVNSGLFLEAKLPPAMAQADLIKELPQLIRNESVPQSLQRIAAEILQNLTQKQPLSGSSGLEQQLAGSKLELTSPAVNPADDGMASKEADKLLSTAKAGALVETTDAAGKNTMQQASAEDFKANLLKFIHALKQELNPQGEQQLNQTDLDLLKNLQNKTENTVAKLVLDQLMSLPKDDNPKQQWIIDIPFIDRHQAESVKIEIQQDKENKQQSGSNDWSVNITITPPELGTIHCMVSYRHDVINTFFKSQNTQTTELIKHNLDYLKNQLEASGLTTGHMDAHDGSPKTQAPHQLTGKKLFDDKA
ncbi:MAG: flagellar hook-length control protein FliK [Methylobacter sp.]|nr:flagellar hook-length control protein FliK [Methylobacter sp.]